MNVSKFTLSCRWLSSASFSVASSSIPSSSAFSSDAASNRIQSSSMVLGALASPQRLGRRRCRMLLLLLLLLTAVRLWPCSEEPTAEPSRGGKPSSVCKPFKGTLRRAGCRERVASQDPPRPLCQHPKPNLLLSNLLSHWILMNLQFGAKTGNPHRPKEKYQQISSGDNEHWQKRGGGCRMNKYARMRIYSFTVDQNNCWVCNSFMNLFGRVLVTFTQCHSFFCLIFRYRHFWL